ncbi:MAG: MBL fold metallo-hydrolase [Planctomycetota bacterium]|nr:MAG: MBL fold metallo-hydrolase [Planctomycetota bacterium]
MRSVKPRYSSAVMLVRWGREGWEVFLVRRGRKSRFMPGFYALIGGKVDREDRELAMRYGYLAEEVTAIRELFEEVGIFLHSSLTSEQYRGLCSRRGELLSGELSFAELLEEVGVELEVSSLFPLGVRTTPEFAPIRYRTQFYLALFPTSQEVDFHGEELEDGRWAGARVWLERWQREGLPLPPPVRHLLEFLVSVSSSSLEEVVESLRVFDDSLYTGRVYLVQFEPSVLMLPLATGTIAPATHTNCYFLGQKEFYILDPAASEGEGSEDCLLRAIDQLSEEGRRPRGILLTHHHRDHVGGVVLLQRRFSLPLLAHRWTLEDLPFDLEGEVYCLEDGEVLETDVGGWEVLHTPGHARGHLCFYLRPRGVLLAGDMVSTISTIFIPPFPEGDLGLYMGSLERLLDLSPRWLFPSHGPPTCFGRERIASYLRHRRMRERQILEALSGGREDFEELFCAVYGEEELSSEAQVLARLSLRSGLEKLVREGRVVEKGEGRYSLNL